MAANIKPAVLLVLLVLALLLLLARLHRGAYSVGAPPRAAAGAGGTNLKPRHCRQTSPDTAGVLRLTGCGLSRLPPDLDLGGLRFLDISGNCFSALPRLPASLRTLFVSNNCAEKPLGALSAPLPPRLRIFGARNSGIRSIGEGVLPSSLIWLILTANQLTALPADVGRLTLLRKAALADNDLRELPAGASNWSKLELIRLSANDRLRHLPRGFLRLPRLSWLALGQSCVDVEEAGAGRILPPTSALPPIAPPSSLPRVALAELAVLKRLGSGASGSGLLATWHGHSVVVKQYSAAVGTDGKSEEEMRVAIPLRHPSISAVVAVKRGWRPSPGGRPAHGSGTPPFIVLEALQGAQPLGSPPSLDTVTRDVYPWVASTSLAAPSHDVGTLVRLTTRAAALRATLCLATALTYLHETFSARLGVCHGDIYAHNTLHGGVAGNVTLLSDFGAAFFYDKSNLLTAAAIQAAEARAFGVFAEELLRPHLTSMGTSVSMSVGVAGGGDQALLAMIQACLDKAPWQGAPLKFSAIAAMLQKMLLAAAP